MNFAAVDSIAQGRVWSGSEALKIGLVDKIGGLNAAIVEAARLGKTQNYSTQNYPEYEKSIDDVLSKFPFGSSKASIIKEEIGNENYQLLQQIKKVQSRRGIQALLPFEIAIY